MSRTIEIGALGAKGDGVAAGDGGPLFVPFGLPGEIVEAEGGGERAVISTIVRASPERREPPCPHFGICGGCDLQHASDALYRDFKRDVVLRAFAQRGLDAPVGELIACPPASRRRAVFSAQRSGDTVLFGFHEAFSHQIAPIQTCLIVVPAIAERLEDLRALAALAADRKRELRMTVTSTASGLDIVLAGTAKLNERLRRALVSLSTRMGFARLTAEGEILAELRKPVVMIGGIAVALPPGSFIQAAAEAESGMARLVEEHLAGRKPIADLFAGIGTFALRLARASAVHAVEQEEPARATLDAAWRMAAGLKPITSERRDLFRRPLTAKELARFGGVVFDPPRAGAEAQAQELARSSVSKVAAVSCNPTTLARDARLLVDGGYRLVSVTPIDQFVWSHHVEAVALFER